MMMIDSGLLFRATL